jgi:hypothetical protein
MTSEHTRDLMTLEREVAALDAKLHRLWVVVGINSTALLLVLGRVSHVW